MLSKEGRRELTKGTRKGAMNWGREKTLEGIRQGGIYRVVYILFFNLHSFVCMACIRSDVFNHVLFLV